MKAFDPTDAVKRPQDSYHPNIEFSKVGIGFANSNFKEEKYRTLSSLLEENGDTEKTITYLKMDVEGAEFGCFEDWFETGIFTKVQQFGIEFHVSNKRVKNQVKFWFQKFNKYLGKLVHKYNFRIVDSEPNKCAGKREDGQRTYYTFNDVLLIKT